MSKLLYYILYGGFYLISLLPYRVLYGISDIILYPILYKLLNYRRSIVQSNLRHAFPDKSQKERIAIERKFYHFLCDYFMETIKLISISKQELMRRMVMKGTDEMYKSFDKNTMLFIYLGHFCNWEYIASLQWWMPSDVLCTQIYSALRNDVFDLLFYKIRSRFGGMNIEKNISLRIIMDQKRKGQKTIVGFISDQCPRWVNIHLFTPFLHQDTAVFTGTERIARKVKASVFISHLTRPRRGYYECQYQCLTLDVDKDFPENELTKCYMHDLEKQIEANPHLWLWTHNRWHRQRTDEDAPEEWKATIQNGQVISETPIKTNNH
ncbi:MAG: acetyltransferase [Bacteroidaceae bacterium]|nr:acetyltransferase [Bacteroidaceae bacterium]